MLQSLIRRTTANPLVIDAIIGIAAAASCVIYLLAASLGRAAPGFPLDDAWIYQVYARNLASHGEWAFVIGVPSTGSTSVLWTLFVAPAYVLHIDGRVWTLVLGILSLIATAVGASRLILVDKPLIRLAIGAATALEWHMVWAAVSGMETVFFTALLTWFWAWTVSRLSSNPQHLTRDGFLLGLWGGALTLARPEGILAFAVAVAVSLLRRQSWKNRLRWATGAAVGLAALLGPLVVFNVMVGGTPWPNTLIAKQAEYAVLLDRPIWARLIEQVSSVFVGPQLLLIPALAAWIWLAARGGPTRWVDLAPLLWAGLHLLLFALRLPVTYQHARYAMPTIPVVVAYGIAGMAQIIQPRARSAPLRVASLSWVFALVVLFPAFVAMLGAPAYVRDLRFVDGEMGAAARWLGIHSSSGDVIAVHDIGALGYFAPHRIVDLAGLVSPEVIGFINNDDLLTAFILAKKADYLVVFPHWSAAYERLVTRPQFCKVWSADQEPNYVPYSSQGPMTIYRVVPDGRCPAPS